VGRFEPGGLVIMAKMSVYEVITTKIISLIESGKLDWRKTWSLKAPVNYVSEKPYTGINFIMLAFSGEKSPYWLTYKQATELGGNVMKGAKGYPVCFYTLKEDETSIPEKPKKYGVFKYYTVFNADQCEGIPTKDDPVQDVKSKDEIMEMISQHNPEIIRGRPAYNPGKDVIKMPNPEEFESSDAYWKTFFHELTHWTGHESRLARDGIMEINEFGSESYSKEELIAELGAAFLSMKFNLSEVGEQEAAYIQSWIKPLKNDPKMIIQAASKAQKAMEYLIN